MRYLITFIILGICLIGKGQSFFPHHSIKRVIEKKEDHLLISSVADLNAINLNPAAFSHVNSVCINGKVDINQALSVLYQLDEVFELKLRRYEGQIRKFGGDSLDLFEDIIYYMTYRNSPDLETLDRFPKLSSLTIIHPGPVVEDFYLITRIKNAKTVNILGDFLKPDMDSVAHYISRQKQITHLGLGLDFITDIPNSVLAMPRLKVLTVFDNASHVRNIEYVDYPMDKRFMNYSYKGKKRTLELRFFSDRSKLEPFDMFYLQKLRPKAGFAKTNSTPSKVTKRISTSFSMLATDTIVKIDYASHAHPAANLPVPYLNPTVEYYEVDPTKNITIYTKNGTELRIPALSLVRPNGTVVKQTVVISFADLSNSLNSFLAGLNLYTRRKGQELHLNPLHAFEIKAFEKGSALKLKDGLPIKATFMLPRDTVFDQYVLDPVKRTWRPMTGYYYTSQLSKIKNLSYSDWKENVNSNTYFAFDNKSFSDRYLLSDYCFLMGAEDKKNNFDKRRGQKFHSYATHYFYTENKNSVGVKRGKKLIRIVKIPREEGEAKNLIKTQFEDVFEHRLFPELKAFRKYQFKTLYSEGRREFSKEYTSRKRYFDIRIIYKKQEAGGVIELKDESGYKHLDFFVPKEEIELFNKLYQNYSNILQSRGAEFDAILKSKENKFKQNYFQQRKQEGYKEYSMTLTNFGIYSSSNEASIDKPKEIIANFTDRSGIPIDLKRCYIFHRNHNSIYSFTDGNITFDKHNVSGIICTDHKGDVFYIDGESLSYLNLEDYSYSVIKMYRMEEPVKTAEAFRTLIGLK